MKLFLKKLIDKFIHLKITHKIIIISSIALIVLFLMNSIFIKKDQTGHSNNTVNNFSVKIQECEPQNRTIYLNFSGTVNPLHQVSLISKVSGKVTDIYLSDGDEVKEDDVVLKIEDYDRVEQIEKAKSLLKQREIEYESSKKLNQKGYKAQIQVEAAFTALQSARADLKRLELDLENITIKSPINGYIDKINVNEGDFVNIGQKMTDVVNFDQVVAVLYASENEVDKIKLGSIAQINLLDGRELEGKVHFIRLCEQNFAVRKK